MKEEFVTYEIAKKLKGKGFKEKCVAHYFDLDFDYNVCQHRGVYLENLMFSFNKLCETMDLYPTYYKYLDAPTISQVLKWLREEKNTHVLVDFVDKSWLFDLRCLRTGFIVECDTCRYETYEQAAIAGIEFVIDNLI